MFPWGLWSFRAGRNCSDGHDAESREGAIRKKGERKIQKA